ncbi:type I-E CRISPR-associated protein Cse2/CasB [Marinobacter sp.]|uniref:type I-E CRISPR-associated protein Cse2/CasB n=1 Tax=Marinobacter sp. TaxID=50741 RepID=UPI003A90BFED
MEPMQPQEQQPKKAPPSREERFVAGVLKLCAENKGMAARLRRADNPATEYQSWELLATYGIDLEQERERLPFVCVAATIAKAKAECNGSMGLGRAIAACYENGNATDQAKARLRRLLACDDLSELCRILRPLLSLIGSKVGQGFDYIRLLKQLRRFPFHAQQVKAQWAQEFYGHTVHVEKEGV